MRRIADGHEAAVPIPLIVSPVPVQLHAVLIAVDVRAVQVTFALHGGRQIVQLIVRITAH
ncbi:MAG: hypothetical protein HY567_01230 [Candidatus Kerfeldbacteria bacterium]|nr:hypothetical protein [Candidatus Kerfeldbacteria bacterium]